MICALLHLSFYSWNRTEFLYVPLLQWKDGKTLSFLIIGHRRKRRDQEANSLVSNVEVTYWQNDQLETSTVAR